MWEVNIFSKLKVPSSHADAHLLGDRGDTCLTLATWLYRQEDIFTDLINQLIMKLFVEQPRL